MGKSDPLKESKYFAWFDLECSGNRDDDRIIEVGFALTDRGLNEVMGVSFTVRPPNWESLLARMDPVVVEMHTQNGLISDVGKTYLGIETVDEVIADFIQTYAGTNHVPFAGSGVGHFDRRFINREMPLTDKRLTYWPLDIGVVRRWLTVWGILLPPSAKDAQAKTHRALDDIREHIKEARIYGEYLKRNEDLAWRYEGLSD